MSNGLDPDQDRHSVHPDLGPSVCKGYQQMTKTSRYKFTGEALSPGTRHQRCQWIKHILAILGDGHLLNRQLFLNLTVIFRILFYVSKIHKFKGKLSHLLTALLLKEQTCFYLTSFNDIQKHTMQIPLI